MRNDLTRRTFAKRAGAAMSAWVVVPRFAIAARSARAPSDRLNVACIGVGGRGGANLDGVRRENVVALCDVDARRTEKTFQGFPAAKRYEDFRKMFDDMEKGIDAVVVSTPDHTHAVAAMAAIKRGKHLYCEKPLAHSIGEIRALMKAAREHKVVTQLGNQGHSFETIRTFCEWIWDGAIGAVHTVHAASSANHCRIEALSRVAERHEVPAGLAWDLWLGPAKLRPYNPMYLPGRWRAWMPFGCGSIGDWVCHVVDPVFWALDLGAPDTVVANADGYDPKAHADTFPPGSIIEFEFPARGKRGPVKLIWYDGVKKIPRPNDLEPDKKPPDTGAIVCGDRGSISYGSHGAGDLRIFPEAKMKAYKKPERTIPRVRGHYEDWLGAIRGGAKAGSDFEYGGPLTELALLGIVATRLLGTKLKWDGPNMRFAGCDEANQLLNPPYREGWTL